MIDNAPAMGRPGISSQLLHARRLMFSDRLGEAMAEIEKMLAGPQEPYERVAALTLRLIALINMGRSAEYPAALDDAWEASRTAPDTGQRGELYALAAIVALRSGSLDLTVSYLVYGARALNAVEMLDATIAWAWHNLAMAYSYTGFHGHATAAVERAREVAVNVGLPTANTDFAVPALRVRLAVDLDQRGDSDGCARILLDVVNDLDRKVQEGILDRLRPVSRGAYGYAAVRLTALGYQLPELPISPQALLDSAGDSSRSRDLRALGAVCQAIGEHNLIEAMVRLETLHVSDDTLGAAEVYRLRALAHEMAGDHEAAHRTDRHSFRVASSQIDRLRDLFVDGVAARLDHEDLRRRVEHFQGVANTDTLTGLPNRRYLYEYIAQLVETGHNAVLGVCDLDGFKAVNTTHGHLTGDLVLQRVAGVLNRVMRRGDFVARYGGDEFVVVLPTSSLAEVKEISRRISTAVNAEEWQALAPGTPVGVTIGWARVGSYPTVVDAFEAADHDMLSRKAKPRI